MRITNDGNVGIGTTAPTNTLTVSGSVSASFRSAIRTRDNADTHPQLLIEGNMAGTSPAAGALLELKTNIDFRARGIHMTTADTSENEEWFAGVPYKGAGYSIGYDSTGAGRPWYKISSSFFISESDLFVGVGTVLPKAKLHLSGSDVASHSAIRQSRAGRAIWDQAIDSSGRLQWGYRAAGSEGGTRTVSFTLDNDSRVGMGFGHDPSKLLHVSGGSGDAAILLEKSTNDATIESRTNAAGAYFKANSVGASNYYGLELNNDTTGNWFLGSYGYADFSIVDGAKSSGTRHFTVKNTTGNVGIGTTAAPEKLTVEGSISASGTGSFSAIGVGVDSPTRPLHVAGGAIIADTALIDNPLGSNATLEVYDKAGDAKLVIHHDDGDSSKTAELRFRNGGNDTYFKVPSSTNGLVIDTEGKTNAFVLDINGKITSPITASSTISASGEGYFSKVGVGTDSPSQGLHVVDAGIITSEFESSNNSSALIEVSNNAGLDAFFGVYSGNLVLRHDDYTANHFSMDTSGNITASGDISASGTIIGNLVPQVPKVEMLTVTSSTLTTNTTMTLPNSLTYITSSGGYEYLEIFTDGIRLNRTIDYAEVDTSSVRFLISIPSQSIITYKSLRTV
jgi:hypothetical protein